MPYAGLFTRGTDVEKKFERSKCIQCLCQPTYTEQYELIHNIKHHLSLGFWITLIEDSCPLPLLYTAVGMGHTPSENFENYKPTSPESAFAELQFNIPQ